MNTLSSSFPCASSEYDVSCDKDTMVSIEIKSSVLEQLLLSQVLTCEVINCKNSASFNTLRELILKVASRK